MHAVILTLLAQLPAHPAGDALLAHASRLTEAKVGDWVTYRFASAERGGQYFRLAVVEAATDRLGRDALWIEMAIGEYPDLEKPIAQIRVLAARASGLRAEGVTRVIAAVGAASPAEIPPDRLVGTGPRGAASGGEGTVRVGRESSLITAAGTLPAVPVEVAHRGAVLERLWLSRRIPLLQLARLELVPIGHSAEVWDYGSDAHSRMVLPAPNGLKMQPEHAEERP
jgi:hypothetical protein